MGGGNELGWRPGVVKGQQKTRSGQQFDRNLYQNV